MKPYQGSEIRNVAVVGHAHSGKTTLIAALLHAAKMTPAQGRVREGTAATAYDEEEVARGTTMQNASKSISLTRPDSISFAMRPAPPCCR
jgi:elongation factor G